MNLRKNRLLGRLFGRLLSWGLVVAILGYMFLELNRQSDVWVQMISRARLWPVVSHLILMLVFFFLLVSGWIYLLKKNALSVSWREGAWTFLVANLGKNIPGKVFMFAARVELCRRVGVTRKTAFGVLVLEHLILILACVPFVLLGLPYFGQLRMVSEFQLTAIAVILAFGVVLVLIPKRIVGVLNTLIERFGYQPIAVDRSALLWASAIYLVSWCVYGFSGVALAAGLGWPEAATFPAVFFAFIAAWLIGFLSFITPAGLGIREGTLVFLLSAHTDAALAILLAMTARLTWFCVETGLSLVALLFFRGGRPAAGRDSVV